MEKKIDVIEWNEDPSIYIASALLPAQILAVDVKEDEKFAEVIVPDDQLSLAIGKSGQNARLAAKLTNWKIDIKSESQMREILQAQQKDTDAKVEDEKIEKTEMKTITGVKLLDKIKIMKLQKKLNLSSKDCIRKS